MEREQREGLQLFKGSKLVQGVEEVVGQFEGAERGKVVVDRKVIKARVQFVVAKLEAGQRWQDRKVLQRA